MKKLFILLVLVLVSCKEKNNEHSTRTIAQGDTLSIDYAKGFELIKFKDFKILKVNNPYPGSKETHTYILSENGTKIPNNINYNQKVNTPLKKIVATSTTHIPMLDMLSESNSVVGFPHLDYISSPIMRDRIKNNKVAELGENENLNTEVLLSLQPDAVVGFTMQESNKVYKNISQSNIPVIYNGDWNEESPLGKAEWIKFFGALYNKEKLAEEIFDSIAKNYNETKELTLHAIDSPTVITGALYKDIWHLPKGDSWAAQFIEDAHANYIYKNTKGSGSLSISIEEILDKAQHADFWIGPDEFTSYKQLKEASKHYTQMSAFHGKNIFSYGGVKGDTGGLLYFELAPSRPDIVLKDLVHIFHPYLLPKYEPRFYKPLE